MTTEIFWLAVAAFGSLALIGALAPPAVVRVAARRRHQPGSRSR